MLYSPTDLLDRAQGDAQLPTRTLWRRGDRQHLGVVVRWGEVLDSSDQNHV